MTSRKLRDIWEKTKGHCHFCGDPVTLDKRGWSEGSLDGFWEVDHIIQKGKGGSRFSDNCLPACTRCNRLRWHRYGEQIRDLLFFGLIAQKEIKKCSQIGKALSGLREKRLQENVRRRKLH